jgi:hypothetical protein
MATRGRGRGRGRGNSNKHRERSSMNSDESDMSGTGTDDFIGPQQPEILSDNTPDNPPMSPGSSDQETEQIQQPEQSLATPGLAISDVNIEDKFTALLVKALDSTELQTKFTSMIQKTITSELDKQLRPITDRIEVLEADIDCQIKTSKKCHENLVKDQSIMNTKIRQLERDIRAANLKFVGVPILPENEITKDLGNIKITPQLKYAKSIMKVISEAGIENIQETDIGTIQKINIPGNASNSSILIVKMSSEGAKATLYAQRTKLKNCSSKIFLNEDLTREDATVFKKAREEVKKGKLFTAWTKSGLVWVKTSETGKPFQISE